jgi:NADH dehydrogenase/NADH:ubiquinone oxidoreductase subunit G
VGDLAPTEAAFALKQLVEGQGGSVECRTDGAKLPAGNRSAYVGTAAIEDIDDAKYIMLIGTNPRDRGAGAECAHPQGMDARRECGPDRPGRRSDL